MVPSLLLLSCESSVSVKENPDSKKKKNMTNYPYFVMPRAKTVNHGLESLSYIGSKLWDSMPSHMKEIDSINEFKHVIETWKPDLC